VAQGFFHKLASSLLPMFKLVPHHFTVLASLVGATANLSYRLPQLHPLWMEKYAYYSKIFSNI
jgi:hypothetical protein